MSGKTKKILIAEDDERMQKLLSQFLLSEGFEVLNAVNGTDAVSTIKKQQPDLVVLDMMLPDMDGLAVAATVLPAFPGCILMLTAQNEELAEIAALNTGIDDFMSKPVRPHLLLARINALLRRAEKHTPKPEEGIAVQDLVLNTNNRTISQNEEMLLLTDAEYDLLALMIVRSGEVLDRDTLLSATRDLEYDGLDRSIDMRISTLRKKLNDDSPPYRYIRTVRGKGYLLTT